MNTHDGKDHAQKRTVAATYRGDPYHAPNGKTRPSDIVFSLFQRMRRIDSKKFQVVNFIPRGKGAFGFSARRRCFLLT